MSERTPPCKKPCRLRCQGQIKTDGTALQYAKPERRNGENKPFVSCLAQPKMNLKGLLRSAALRYVAIASTFVVSEQASE